MNDNEVWVFLSHSNKDYEKVRQVRNMLEQESLRPSPDYKFESERRTRGWCYWVKNRE